MKYCAILQYTSGVTTKSILFAGSSTIDFIKSFIALFFGMPPLIVLTGGFGPLVVSKSFIRAYNIESIPAPVISSSLGFGECIPGSCSAMRRAVCWLSSAGVYIT